MLLIDAWYASKQQMADWSIMGVKTIDIIQRTRTQRDAARWVEERQLSSNIC